MKEFLKILEVLSTMNYKRFGIATLTGALLGVLCILGASGRIGGWTGNEVILVGLWYNRVIMGMIIGLAGNLIFFSGTPTKKWLNTGMRGLIFGIIVSLQFFLSSDLLDWPTFLAGFAYGIVIDLLATALGVKKSKE